MSFKLKSDKSLRKSIRRLSCKQIDGALEDLEGDHAHGQDEAIHDARKRFKKLRAMLRLVRPVVGEEVYRNENTSFRDAGRPLTEVRDAKILIETFDDLNHHFDGPLSGTAFEKIRAELKTNLREVRHRVLNEENAFAAVACSVRQARERVDAWTDVPDKWPSVGEGLFDTYRRACTAFELAGDDPTDENLHEWRKQAKYLRYQLEALRPLWEPRIAEVADEADQMGTLLGDDHDLAVLRQMVADAPDRFGNNAHVRKLEELIDHRRPELQQEAMLLGCRFFAERPKEFRRRLKGYWRTWRGAERARQT